MATSIIRLKSNRSAIILMKSNGSIFQVELNVSIIWIESNHCKIYGQFLDTRFFYKKKAYKKMRPNLSKS